MGKRGKAASEGLEYIEMVKEQSKKEAKPQTPPKRILSSFGVKDASGLEYRMYWVVSSMRVDKRHGVIGRPNPVSPYVKSLWEGMFRKW
jgi:hypothetical protein